MTLIFTLLLILIIITCCLKKVTKDTSINKEEWQNYVQKPYNFLLTGRDPLYFYRKDRWRKPYRYPFTFYQSYPFPHLRYGY